MNLWESFWTWVARRLGPAAPRWILCPHCENYWCTTHEMHAHDCPCPPIEDGGTNPYR